MPDFATSRLSWEPRMLSILRIMVGLLYMEHGLAKILDFPHQPNHAPYALFTLVPGLQGLLELIGGLLLALGLFTRTVAFIPRAIWLSPISWRMRREVSFRCSTAAS
jgi:putative oxidoreductase